MFHCEIEERDREFLRDAKADGKKKMSKEEFTAYCGWVDINGSKYRASIPFVKAW